MFDNTRGKSKDFYREHRSLWIIGFTVLCIVVGLLWGFAGRAMGACTHNPDGTCAWTPSHTAYKFRHHYYDRAHGVPVRRVFAHPRKARAVLVAKIEHKIANMTPTQRQKVRDHLGVTKASCDNLCLAVKSYEDWVNNATCTGHRYYSVLSDMCVSPGPKQTTSTQTVKVVGTVFFCGGSVVIGLAGTPATGGGALFLAGWGATSCTFSTWAVFH